MPKYLLEVSYTAEGAKGLLKEGGSKRRAAAEAAIQSVGATSRRSTLRSARMTLWRLPTSPTRRPSLLPL
jgi:hypothetical protein